MKRIMFLTVIGFALGLFSVAVQANTAWDGSGGDTDWFNAANWTNGVPNISTDTTIDGTYTVVIDGDGAEALNLILKNGADLTVKSGRIVKLETTGTCKFYSGTTLTIDGGTVVGATGGNTVEFEGTLNIFNGGSISNFPHSYGYIYMDNVLNMGDATSLGSIQAWKFRAEPVGSTIRGVGKIEYYKETGDMRIHGGNRIADGWGAAMDRELSFGAWQYLTGTSGGNRYGGDVNKGNYATNRAKLTFWAPGVPFTSTKKTQIWGDGANSAPSYMRNNTLQLIFSTITHADIERIAISLYAPDHSEVPTIDPAGVAASIWKFTPTPSFAFSGATTNIFRYDETATGGQEANLSLWHHTGGSWVDLADEVGYTVSLNQVENHLTVSGYPDNAALTGFFVVGVDVEPPPVPPSGTTVIVR